jgi:hypothetical protein
MTTILQEAAAGCVTIVPWTVEQYHRAIETGFMSEDSSVELIDGFIDGRIAPRPEKIR